MRHWILTKIFRMYCFEMTTLTTKFTAYSFKYPYYPYVRGEKK